MALWPERHPHILTLRYEQIVGDEQAAFEQLFRFYRLSGLEHRLGLWFARRYSLRKTSRRDAHVRDPSPGQWREHFTPRVRRAFDAEHGGLVEQLGYSSD